MEILNSYLFQTLEVRWMQDQFGFKNYATSYT